MPYTPQTWADNNPSFPASAARFTHIESGLQTAAATADAAQPLSAKDAANGYAGLDSSGLLKLAEFPASVVFAGKLPWFLMPAASGDTSGTTDGAAITAALASGFKDIAFGNGAYFDNVQRAGSLASTVGVRFHGATGMSAGATPGTRLVYTGSAASYLAPGDSSGFTLENIQVLYNNASFAGTLIDATATVSTSYLAIRRCYLGSLGGLNSAAALLNLSNCQDVKVDDCALQNADVLVIGRTASGNFSNAVTFSNVHFAHAVTRSVKNAGQAWGFTNGCVFEPLNSGGAGAYASDFTAASVSFENSWFGDASIGATNQIAFSGVGLSVRGCYIGNNALGGGGGVIVGANSSGIDIRGNSLQFMGVAIDLSATGILDADVGPNDYQNVTTPIKGGASLSKSRRRGWLGLLTPDFPFAPGASAPVANQAYVGRFVPSEDMVATAVAFVVTTGAGTSTDTCDVGIYDSAGNRVVSSGSVTATLNAAGRKAVTITATTLRAGVVYYAAFAQGTPGSTSIQVAMATVTDGHVANLMGGLMSTGIGGGVFPTSFPLPSTVAIPTVNNPMSVMLGVMQ